MNISKAASLSIIAAIMICSVVESDESAKQSTTPKIPPPATMEEARARATLLHETIRGSLQVMHRDFFDEEDTHAIPSRSLEDVFEELSKSYDVRVKWLIVDTDVVNVDHQPEGEFEKQAATDLAEGRPRVESLEGDRYRYAGPIRLASQCLKCHVQNRTSTEDRTAGLLISMPFSKHAE